MNYALYVTIMIFSVYTQSSAMVMKLTRATRPGLSTRFSRYCHTANLIEHELTIVRCNLSGLISERKTCQEARQFKSLSGMDLYYKGLIEAYDQKIPILQSHIKDLESQLQQISNKNNLQKNLAKAELEYQITELRNKRQQRRESGEPTAPYDEKIQSLEKRIQSLSIQSAIKN